MVVSTYKSEDRKVALNFSSGMPAELADALARGRLRKTATSDVSGLDPAICWQAMQSRDRRFDGGFSPEC
jgi:hypothetical protein